MAVSKRLRFEVFKRDGYRCRYCGATADDAKLTIDHVLPQTLGGRDEAQNLVTACAACNAGKSSVPPDADTVADVTADAIRWARAIKRAAEVVRGEADEDAGWVLAFYREWARYGWDLDTGRVTVPLPDDYERSVARFRHLGLDFDDICQAVDLAMRAKDVPHDRRFNYFCGVGHRKLERLTEIAARLIAEEAVA